MTSAIDRPTRTKALLAIAFAGSILSSQLPARGQESRDTSSSSSSSSLVEAIAKNDRATPEVKAYCLLQLAYCYCAGNDTAGLETHIKLNLVKSDNGSLFHYSSRTEPYLSSWASSVSLLSHSVGAKAQSQTGDAKISKEHRAFADKAITAAIAQLGLDFKEPHALKLNMYLIASGLSRMIGNMQNEQKCTKELNAAIQACEANKTVDSAQIKAVASILNSIAFGLIPVHITDYQAQSPQQLPEFDMKSFDECERLKLRAAALLDRLPTGDQERRKAHRDLSLWYSQLGRDDKALSEKEELFKLVGVKDDRILYPQSGVCGHPMWWTTEKLTYESNCGMG